MVMRLPFIISPDCRPVRLWTLLAYGALAASCFAALPAPALAQEHAAPAQAQPAATRIEVDESANVIRFFVKGKEKARITEAGLQVREDVEFGGTLTDVGTAPFDAAAPGPKGDADAP